MAIFANIKIEQKETKTDWEQSTFLLNAHWCWLIFYYSSSENCLKVKEACTQESYCNLYKDNIGIVFE